MLIVLLTVAAARLCAGTTWGWPQGNLLGAMWRAFVPGWTDDQTRFDLLLDIRLSRLVLAVLVGWALATSGVALQSLLRNPLAEPFILGLSSGAAVGVMVQTLAGHYLQRPFGPMHAGALIGACLSMGVVYTASRRRGMIDPLGLLLIGVVLSTVNGAIIVLLNYAPGSAGLRDDIARWMIGYLNESVTNTATIPMTATLIAGGFAWLVYQAPAMDVATFSDTEAISLGVNLKRLRFSLFLVAGVLAAAGVVLAGPIAFVGLICPHVTRLLLGPSHRTLLLGAAMAGATLMVFADTASVMLDFGQGRLPLGIFTAVLGGPVFIAMLRPQLGRAT